MCIVVERGPSGDGMGKVADRKPQIEKTQQWASAINSNIYINDKLFKHNRKLIMSLQLHLFNCSFCP